MMIQTQDEIIAALANDVFNKRQRLIRAGQPCVETVDDRTMKALEAEYRVAESEYLESKAAFARAMNESRRI